MKFVAIFCLSAACLLAQPAPKPNILLILADDLGYSDLGCYGGEIRTPNLDTLAAGGVRFTQFYNSARCCPSRASLLTGQYPHAAGFPHMSGSLPARCVTILEVLKAAGYRTFMAGKWHLGTPGPIARGFEEFYGLLGGYGSFWNPQLYVRLPKERPTRTHESFYATDAITDYALEFIAQTGAQPWFLYLAYTAPHFPLHAPKEDIARYADTYTKGWDAIRAARYQRQKELGLVDQRWALSPRSVIPPNPVATMHGWSHKENPSWDSVPAERRADLARRMAIYAAMVDRMDQNIGRILAALKQRGAFENTLIFFLSDNGACAEWDPWGFDVLQNVHQVNLPTTQGDNILHTGAALENMGGVGTYHSYGSGWANACNTPFRLYKHYNHEGGIATPLIVHWPAGLSRRNQIERRFGHIMDLLPTCAEAARAAYPSERVEGRSLWPLLRGEPTEVRTLFFEHEKSRAVRQGKWKLVALEGQPWELYDMEADGTEVTDLAKQHPDKVKVLSALWDKWWQRMQPWLAAGKKAAKK